MGKAASTFPTLTAALLMAPGCLHAESTEAWIRPLPTFEAGASAVVVAAVDDVFRVQRIGETIFQNKTHEYPVPDWQFAGPLERHAAENLQRVAAMPVKAADEAETRAQFADFKVERRAKRGDRQRMRTTVIKMGKRSGATYVVVVCADQSVRDPFFNTNVSTPPFGIVQDDRPFKPGAVLQAHLALLIFDARNGDQLSFAVQTHNVPHALLPKNTSPSAGEVESLRSDVLHLFQLAVATSLRDMRELRDDG